MGPGLRDPLFIATRTRGRGYELRTALVLRVLTHDTTREANRPTIGFGEGLVERFIALR